MSKKTTNGATRRATGRRFSLRSLLALFAVVAVLLVLLRNWGEILVAVRADRVLVPWGVGLYGHGDLAITDEPPSDRAELISSAGCGACHEVSFPAMIAFPPSK